MHSCWSLRTMSLISARMHRCWERASYLSALLFVSYCLPFLSCPRSCPHSQCREQGNRLRQRPSWWGKLNSPLGQILPAMSNLETWEERMGAERWPGLMPREVGSVCLWRGAGRRFWGGGRHVFVFPTCNVWLSRACCQRGYVLIPAGGGGPLRGVRGGGGLRGAHGWGAVRQSGGLGETLSSGLCLSPRTCTGAAPAWTGPRGRTLRELERPPLYCPKSITKKRGLLFWKLSKEDLDGCSVLIKNWWENRCLNPGFGVINLPAPNTGKRESRERQMPLQLTKTSWYRVRFKEFIFLPVSS